MSLYELLNLHKHNILTYLFDDNINIINFEENKTIKLDEKWVSILNYPEKLYVLRRKNTTKSVIVSLVIESLLNKKDRAINPILIIIFHNELSEYIKYCNIDENDNIVKLVSNNKNKLKEIRFQINLTFKLYWKLINDSKIKQFAYYYTENKIVQEIINSLYYKVTVEELIKINETKLEIKKVRFNDLCLSVEINENLFKQELPVKYIKYTKDRQDLSESQCDYQNKILIEINEAHHQQLIDYIRKTAIYQTTGKLIIDYYIYENKLNDVYNNVMKEIAKTIYKNYDNDLGIIFYLVNVENIDIEMSIFFLDIRKNKDGTPIKIILDIFKNWNYTNKKDFMKMIKKELNNDYFFVFKDNNKFKNSLLSSLGIDRLIFLPRTSDFINTDEILDFVKVYNKFREGFFNTIESFLSNQKENSVILYLVNKLVYKETFQEFKTSLITSLVEKNLNHKIIDAIEKKFNIELDHNLPILIKSKGKYNNIEFNIMKNTFGNKISEILENKFDDNLLNIENRIFINKEIIDFILNFSEKTK